ncbi:MAG: type III secretion inner membrane ring lipoprotein SctJ [Dongiaceae bacterium]
MGGRAPGGRAGKGRRLGRWLVLLALPLLLAACKVELYSSLTEQEANEILAALLPRGIDAEKVPGKEQTSTINVEKSQLAQAIEILKAEGLPREKLASMGEVFQKQGLVSSPLEERVRLIYALSQELSSTLAHIDGVVTARVHVVLSEGDTEGASTPSSAAVFIKYRENYDLDVLVPQIKRLVTNSIAGLAYDKVSVVLIPAEAPLPAAAAAAEPAPAGGLRQVLMVRLDKGSMGTFLAIVGSLVVLLVAALGASGFLYWRLRESARKPAVADGG